MILSNTLSSMMPWNCQSNLDILCFYVCGFLCFMILTLGIRGGDEYISGYIFVMALFGWLMITFWTVISQSPSVIFLVPSKTFSFSFTAISIFYLKIQNKYRHTVVLLIRGIRWWVLVVSLLSMQLLTILLIMAICLFWWPIFSRHLVLERMVQ